LVVLTNVGLERCRADPLTGATSLASPLSTECARFVLLLQGNADRHIAPGGP
jgi:hypothetical protein